MIMESCRDVKPKVQSVPGNGGQIIQNDPLSTICLRAADELGVQRMPMPLPNFSLSSFLAASSFYPSPDTVFGDLHPSESIYTEAARLRVENGQLKVENTQLGDVQRRNGEQDLQIKELTNRNMTLEMECARWKNLVKMMNKESTNILKCFLEGSKTGGGGDEEQNIACSAELDQLSKYVDAQERYGYLVDEEQMEQRVKCFQNVIQIIKTQKEDSSMRWHGVEEHILQKNLMDSKKAAEKALKGMEAPKKQGRREEEPVKRAKRTRRASCTVSAPTYEPEDANDGSFTSFSIQSFLNDNDENKPTMNPFRQ